VSLTCALSVFLCALYICNVHALVGLHSCESRPLCVPHVYVYDYERKCVHKNVFLISH